MLPEWSFTGAPFVPNDTGLFLPETDVQSFMYKPGLVLADGRVEVAHKKVGALPAMLLIGLRVNTAIPDLNGYYAGWHWGADGVRFSIVRRTFGGAKVLAQGQDTGLVCPPAMIRFQVVGNKLTARLSYDGTCIDSLTVEDDIYTSGSVAIGRSTSEVAADVCIHSIKVSTATNSSGNQRSSLGKARKASVAPFVPVVSELFSRTKSRCELWTA